MVREPEMLPEMENHTLKELEVMAKQERPCLVQEPEKPM